jgi:hypothetical protein
MSEKLVINEDMEITEENFHKYFFDVRQHKPSRDQVIAKYTAMAEFVEGHLKNQTIALLTKTDKAHTVTQLMRKLGCSNELDSYRVPLKIAEDLANGVSPEEVEAKPYKYQMEMFFYTWKECVPKDDPHWEIISIKNLDDFLDSTSQNEEEIQVKARIVEDSPESSPSP